MGKAAVAVVFVIGFVIFLILKTVVVGTKAAYEAVFDPTAKDDRAREVLELCMLRVSHAMHETYRGGEAQLRLAILELTPMVQSMILDRGYRVDSQMARALVCRAIVAGGHATTEQVANA